MLIKHVMICQKEFVDWPLRVTNDTIHHIGTTIYECAIMRMHISCMPYDLGLLWYMNFQRHGKNC